jgi:hypothetical protein
MHKHFKPPYLWESSRLILTDPDNTDTHYDYRIHPDDEHLQYGPISTALREVALTGDCEDADVPYCRVEIEREDGYWESTEEQRCVFLLILAEALADEGM